MGLTAWAGRRQVAGREALNFLERILRGAFGIRMTGKMLSQVYTQLLRHQAWNIGLVDLPIHAFLEPDARPSVRWLPPLAKGRYLADPFGISDENGIHILCEEFDYARGKGVISEIEIPHDGAPSAPRRVLQLPVHMSYPYLFVNEREIYCIPEASATRRVTLYRAEQFPHRWAECATLMNNVLAIDSTVFPHEGRWWLMYTDAKGRVGQNDKLLAWHARSPFGSWEPHPQNPVKLDSGSARPGGTPFVARGTLYRPAQDCSRGYGARIVINRVTRLTPSEFEEEPVAVIEPYQDGPYPEGMHTLSAVGDMTLIDGCRTAFVGSASKWTLERWWRKRKVLVRDVLDRKWSAR